MTGCCSARKDKTQREAHRASLCYVLRYKPANVGEGFQPSLNEMKLSIM